MFSFLGGSKKATTSQVPHQFDITISTFKPYVDNTSLRVRLKCDGAGPNAHTMNAEVQSGIATFDEVLSVIMPLDVQVDDSMAATPCKFQVHEVLRTGSTEKLTKIATMELDLNAVARTLMTLPSEEGVRQELTSKGGQQLVTTLRVRPLHAAEDDEDKQCSDRGSLDGDILFWAEDGSPYDEEADWARADPAHAACMEYEAGVAELRAEAAEVRESHAAERAELMTRIQTLEDENFVLGDENKALQRRQANHEKESTIMRMQYDEIKSQVDRLSRENSSLSKGGVGAEAGVTETALLEATALAESLKQDLAAMQASKGRMETQCREHAAETADLRSSLSMAEAEAARAKKLQAEKDKLSVKCDLLKEELSSLR